MPLIVCKIKVVYNERVLYYSFFMLSIEVITAKFEEIIRLPRETEWVEFKINNYSPHDIGEYISALSNSACLHNEDFSYLVFGVEDITHEIVGTKFRPKDEKVGNEELENWLASLLSPRIDFEVYEFNYIGKAIVILKIDATKDMPVKFKGIEYIRVGSYKKLLKDYPEKARKIWNKKVSTDWSANACIGASPNDLDDKAIIFLREKLASIHSDKKYVDMSLTQLLNSQRLLTNNVPNNTCILYLGKKDSSERLLGEIAKIHWKYEDEKNGVVERMDFYSPLLLSLYELETTIHRFNTYLRDLDLFRQDIKQYDDEAIEELLVNSLAHRDWTISLWVDVVQTPTSVSFRNPGRFRADLEAAIKNNIRPEYLNARMTFLFRSVNLMEQEGGGLRKVYDRQLRKGTRIINDFFDSLNPPFVHFTLLGKVDNEDFAKLVLQKSNIEFEDLLILDKIVSGVNKTPTQISKDDAERLSKLGYIDLSPGRTRRCNISKKFAAKTQTTGKRSRWEKYTKEQEEYQVMNHLTEYRTSGATMAGITQIFDDKGYTYDMCYNIIRRLKQANKIEYDKIKKKWFVIPAVENV